MYVNGWWSKLLKYYMKELVFWYISYRLVYNWSEGRGYGLIYSLLHFDMIRWAEAVSSLLFGSSCFLIKPILDRFAVEPCGTGNLILRKLVLLNYRCYETEERERVWYRERSRRWEVEAERSFTCQTIQGLFLTRNDNRKKPKFFEDKIYGSI